MNMTEERSVYHAHKTGHQVELELLSTHDIDLYCVNSMAVLPSSGEVVVHGDNHKDQYALKTLPKYGLHVYRLRHRGADRNHAEVEGGGGKTHSVAQDSGTRVHVVQRDLTDHATMHDVTKPNALTQNDSLKLPKDVSAKTHIPTTNNKQGGSATSTLSQSDSTKTQGIPKDGGAGTHLVTQEKSESVQYGVTRIHDKLQAGVKTQTVANRTPGGTKTHFVRPVDDAAPPDVTWSHRVLPVTCRHEGVELLAVTVARRQLLAISCPGCGDIKLLDVATGKTKTVYSSDTYKPDYMCHGNPGVLYVNSLGGSYPIMKLDCSSLAFTGTNETLPSGVDKWCSGMCYIPEPYETIVLSVSSQSLIRAVASDSGKERWSIKGLVDGKECHPWGILYLQRRLLVSDGARYRVLVLHPGDGSHLQTLTFPPSVGLIYDLFLHDDWIIMHHKCNVSYLRFKVNKVKRGSVEK